MIQFVREHERNPSAVHLVGVEGAGHWAAAARAQAGEVIDLCAIYTQGFRFANINRLDHPDFLPGGAKYHDLPGMLALSAPGSLWLAGEGESPPEVIRACYQAAGALDHLKIADPEKPATAVVSWLTEQ